MSKFTGHDLIKMGYKPGPWFKHALEALADEDPVELSEEEVMTIVQDFVPPPEIKLRGDDVLHPPFTSFLPQPENDAEVQNRDGVMKAMNEIIRVPTVQGVSVMPDAHPAGTIPVGGVVAVKDAIHPGYHSADVCCSMAITTIKNQHYAKDVLDKIQELTHFGPTKREKRPVELPEGFTDGWDKNPFLTGLERVAHEHFTTQGDGNHFYYVGNQMSTGDLAIVSHHGSRGLGAQVYKRGMAYAQRETKKIAPSIPKGHAWIDMTTEHGEHYWAALQVVREWTKLNHFSLHDEIVAQLDARERDRFWNPHNFVFMKDGLYMHAKGATPSYDGHSPDDDGRTLIPMNMSEPILVTEHTNLEHNLGFAPHGAGRNMSRTQFLRENDPVHPVGIDARFWCGIPDPSELPAAYKSADKVISSIEKNYLAAITDRVLPYGSIMAGDWEQDAPWRKK